MNVKLTATSDLTEWVEKNGSVINASVDDVRNHGEYVDLIVQDANHFLDLITRITEIGEIVLIIDITSDSIRVEIYNDYRE